MSTMSSYADDSKVCMRVDSNIHREQLQADLQKIFNWSDENLMLFNDEKLEYICFSKNSTSMNSTVYKSSSGNVIRKRKLL